MAFQQEPADPSTRPKAKVPNPKGRIPADPDALAHAPHEGGAAASAAGPSSAEGQTDLAGATEMLKRLSPESRRIAVWLIAKLAEGERQGFV